MMMLLKSLTTFAACALVLTGCSSTVEISATPTPTSSSAVSQSPGPTNSKSETSEPTSSQQAPDSAEVPKPPTISPVDQGLASSTETKAQLLYIIEEEKLAFDVYTVMFEKYGARVFGNILKSETTHQDQVLDLLIARKIADPRSSAVGVFKTAQLQTLYNQLIEKGSESVLNAYQVGVEIEELDIDDITVMLASATDSDVIAVLEKLRSGSESHLRAFNNQL
jgi:hypothetical protein